MCSLKGYCPCWIFIHSELDTESQVPDDADPSTRVRALGCASLPHLLGSTSPLFLRAANRREASTRGLKPRNSRQCSLTKDDAAPLCAAPGDSLERLTRLRRPTPALSQRRKAYPRCVWAWPMSSAIFYRAIRSGRADAPVLSVDRAPSRQST